MIDVRRLFPVLVPNDVHDEGMKFGVAMAAYYKKNPTWRSGDRGTESNPERLAQGKIGEAALALFLGFDVRAAINWKVTGPDDGTDMLGPHGIRIDAKTRFAAYDQMIWSREVNDLFESKRFDVLVAVGIDRVDFHRCWIEGFTSKAVFRRTRRTADAHHPHFQVGTWHVPKAELWSIAALDGYASRLTARAAA